MSGSWRYGPRTFALKEQRERERDYYKHLIILQNPFRQDPSSRPLLECLLSLLRAVTGACIAQAKVGEGKTIHIYERLLYIGTARPLLEFISFSLHNDT